MVNSLVHAVRGRDQDCRTTVDETVDDGQWRHCGKLLEQLIGGGDIISRPSTWAAIARASRYSSSDRRSDPAMNRAYPAARASRCTAFAITDANELAMSGRRCRGCRAATGKRAGHRIRFVCELFRGCLDPAARRSRDGGRLREHARNGRRRNTCPGSDLTDRHRSSRHAGTGHRFMKLNLVQIWLMWRPSRMRGVGTTCPALRIPQKAGVAVARGETATFGHLPSSSGHARLTHRTRHGPGPRHGPQRHGPRRLRRHGDRRRRPSTDAARTVTAQGRFAAAPATPATYDSALVPVGASATVNASEAATRTTVTLAVTGCRRPPLWRARPHQAVRRRREGRGAALPVHARPGDAEAVRPRLRQQRERDLARLTTDAAGSGRATSTVPWAFPADRRAASVIIHAMPTSTEPGKAGGAGNRAACLTVGFEHDRRARSRSSGVGAPHVSP